MTISLAILVAWSVMILVMAVLWQVQRITKNAGIVDVVWSFGTALSAVWLITNADGDTTRRWIIGAMVSIWGTRLGWHLFKRMGREEEDGRYQQMRRRWGDKQQVKLFAFFQIQAAWAVLFAMPMLAAATNETSGITAFDFAAIVFWLIAMTGESIADWQLARFKQQADSSGKVCDVGLWHYSRHPNYFFEWLHWWAYPLLAIGSPWWPVALAGPIVMLFFLIKVTGIPPTEARALESRGDAYRRYQHTTSAFIPLPPKKEASHENNPTQMGIENS